MDKMAKDRDDAIRAKAKLEEIKRQEEIERLEKEGKTSEAMKARLTAAEERAEAAEKKLDVYNRDNVVRDLLSGVKFRSSKLAALAAQDITGQLVKDKDGSWVHESGSSIKEFVESYLEDDENADMLAPAVNKGTTTDPANPNGGGSHKGKPKSVIGLSAAEVIEMARKGQLGR